VVAHEHLLWDQARQARDRSGEALPGVTCRPGDHALEVEHLVTDVPLDRELARRDLAGQPLELPTHQVLERALGNRVVRAEVGLEAVERARGEGETDLEAQVVGDDTLVAQRPELPVRVDRVVDARPGVPVQLSDALADLEDGRLVGVARDAARRVGLLDRIHIRVRSHEPLALVTHPGRPRPGLAIG
jgi:hypothetical protein